MSVKSEDNKHFIPEIAENGYGLPVYYCITSWVVVGPVVYRKQKMLTLMTIENFLKENDSNK